MKTKNMWVGMMVKSKVNPNPFSKVTFEVLEIKRGGWVVVRGGTGNEYTCRASIFISLEHK